MSLGRTLMGRQQLQQQLQPGTAVVVRMRRYLYLIFWSVGMCVTGVYDTSHPGVRVGHNNQTRHIHARIKRALRITFFHKWQAQDTSSISSIAASGDAKTLSLPVPYVVYAASYQLGCWPKRFHLNAFKVPLKRLLGCQDRGTLSSTLSEIVFNVFACVCVFFHVWHAVLCAVWWTLKVAVASD